ncbi:hypothetical protein ABT294_19080 [Nonomuraea sp. NPDC000554]|uniref:hypothetical protein n=1 Tax=Nonomuraea sp. NPDC000554 TaxID=3154259 RepID=UPI00332739C9
MGLSGWLLRRAAARPRAFVVGVRYGTRTRLLVEGELGRRGWGDALSPGEAGLLVVCGLPGDDLAAAVRTVWSDIPGPRALVELAAEATSEQVASELDRAAELLADETAQRRDAAERVPDVPGQAATGGHGGHEQHMGSPGGVAMAGRGPDRDGLTLDRLHVPLGPVLADWPSGLVVDTVLQGDVIQQAAVRVPDRQETGRRFWDEPWLAAPEGPAVTRGEAERRRAAAHLDSLGRLLAVAGWPDAARQSRWLRDLALAGASRAELADGHARLARRVRRSKLLAWMLRDLGPIELAPSRPGVSGFALRRVEGDVLDRTYRWLAWTAAAISALDDHGPVLGEDGPRGSVGERPSVALLDVLPALLGGAEWAGARLIVASLDPDLDQLPTRPHPQGTSHG